MGRPILAAAVFLRGARRLETGSSQNWLPHKEMEQRVGEIQWFMPFPKHFDGKRFFNPGAPQAYYLIRVP